MLTQNVPLKNDAALVKLQTTNWANGQYIIKVKAAGKIVTKQFVK
jgi:hypothetical protein